MPPKEKLLSGPVNETLDKWPCDGNVATLNPENVAAHGDLTGGRDQEQTFHIQLLSMWFHRAN